MRTQLARDSTSAASHSELFELLGELARRRFQSAESSFARLGLNHSEARLLKLLSAAGGQAAQEELSAGLGIDRSNSGRALKSLEQQGLILRSAGEDKRRKLVRLTAEGRRKATAAGRLRGEIISAFLGRLSEADAAELCRLLRRI
ncbi:MarR family transcriptional regulator [bacterium]|nr:MarR family transcriptional regulator [bacterium]